MGIMKKFFNNTGKPQGFFGKIMVNGMNSGHASVSDWGMEHLNISTPDNIIEIGCGGGRNAKELMGRYPNAKLTAVDYSDVSVEKTKQTTAKEINENRCKVVQADVSALPFDNNTFDLATAFETVYFWRQPTSFSEVYRVLKNGGTFMIVNESDGANKADEKWTDMIDNMKIYNAEQLKNMLENAGFENITVQRNEEKHWLCISACKL